MLFLFHNRTHTTEIVNKNYRKEVLCLSRWLAGQGFPEFNLSF